MPEGLWDQILLRYGLPGFILLLLFFNLDKIGKLLDGLLQRFFPSYEAKAKEREHRRSLEERQFALIERERVDTVLLFKDMALEQRKRLDDLELENRRQRKEHEESLRNLVRSSESALTRHEHTMAYVVEAVRSSEAAIREQTNGLREIYRWMKNHNDEGE